MSRCIMDGWERERTWRTRRTWRSLREGKKPHNKILSASTLTDLWWCRYTQLADFFDKHLWTYYKSCGWRNLRFIPKWRWSAHGESYNMRHIDWSLKRWEKSLRPSHSSEEPVIHWFMVLHCSISISVKIIPSGWTELIEVAKRFRPNLPSIGSWPAAT